MKKSRYNFLFMLMAVISPWWVLAQPSVSSLSDSSISTFYVDPLGAVYYQYTNGKLVKKASAGDSTIVYNRNKRYGPLHSIVALNPWKVLLFYKNYGFIVLIDKYFQPLSAIAMQQKDIYSASALAPSYDNQIWLYDDNDYRLKKVDDAGNTLMQTEDFRLLFEEAPVPQKILDAGKQLYLYDPQNGLYIFDSFGKFKGKGSYKGWVDFTVANQTVYGSDGQNIYKCTPPVPLADTFALPFTAGEKIAWKLYYPYLYTLDKQNQIERYSLEELTTK